MPTRLRSWITSIAAVDVLRRRARCRPQRAAGDQVVHAVEAAQERGLAAARRADERRDAILVDVERDVLQRLLLTIENADMLRAHLRFAVGRDFGFFLSILAQRDRHSVARQFAKRRTERDRIVERRLAVGRRFRCRRAFTVRGGGQAADLVGTGVVVVRGIFSFMSMGPTSVARSGCGDRWRVRSSSA